MQYVMLDLHFVLFVNYVLHSQSGDDPQEDLKQAWLQSKYKKKLKHLFIFLMFHEKIYIDSPHELMFTLIFHKNLNNVYIDIP